MTTLLAIECSSGQGSLALVRGADLLAERVWQDPRARNSPLFGHIQPLLEEAGLNAAQLDGYVAGRGPGNYAGMRVALTFAQAMALPGEQPVYAVSSGGALAWDLLRGAPEAARVAVVGDARRGQFWAAWFRRPPGNDAPPIQEVDWTLFTSEALADVLPEGAVAASPEWDRIAAAGLDARTENRVRWIREARYPRAAALGRLVLSRLDRHEPMEPCTPLYMHPPVAVPVPPGGG